ncbi:hypothetical protein K1719_015509 [Acacia pycnantha]|nr:hypothetical protein K1719_015509 [Acacia pycnantha]
MAVNVRGVAATIKHVGRAMVERNIRGSIICTASVSSSLAGCGPQAYTVSKHAVLGLVRAACSELGAHGIRVNCVSPYGVATRMTCSAFNSKREEVEESVFSKAVLKGVVLKAKHIAEVALFLASDDSGYDVNGLNFVVDGGYGVVKAIVTQPSARRDRGKKLLPFPLAKFALDRGFSSNLIFIPERAGEGVDYLFELFCCDIKQEDPHQCVYIYCRIPNGTYKRLISELICRSEDMNQRLKGKVALVTGGASGIGEETVRLFADHGAFVVAADVQDELGRQVAASIPSNTVTYQHCDVRDEKQVEETVNFTLQKYGTLDILFSNAGILGSLSGILDLDLNKFDNIMAVNVRGVAATIKHAGRAMVERNIRGSIICTASVSSSLAGCGPQVYTVSKHAVLGLVRATCSELGAHGIRVNCVSPYGVATRMTCSPFNMKPEEIEESICSEAVLKGVVLKAKHIAEAALFLASDDSGYVNGLNFVVDGGYTVVKAKIWSLSRRNPWHNFDYLSSIRSEKTQLRLKGKVALVTGGASGIGEETVRLFADHGAFVVAADVQDELGRQVAASIPSNTVTYQHCDVRDEKQVEETVNFTLQKYGTLDILFSNAGILGSLSGILDLDLNKFDNIMAVNVRGVAATIKHAGRAMVERNIRGSIICTASVSSSLAGCGPQVYTVSKHAVLGLVRAACSELGAHGIRVNCVSPYGVATPLACSPFNMKPEEIEESICSEAVLKGVVLKAKHIAEAALFLASDDSGYVNGLNFVVDGGYTVVKGAFPITHE